MIQLLVGAVLGATTALLLAPNTGAGTRAKLKDQSKRLQYDLERFREYADKKKQQFANKLLGFQSDLECVKDKAQEKAIELKEMAGEVKDNVIEFKDQATEKACELKEQATEKVAELKTAATEKVADLKEKAEDFKQVAGEKADNFKSMASEKAEDIKHLAEKADALKDKAVQKAEVLKNDLGELKKDFNEAIQDFRAPSTDEPKSSKNGEQKSDFPPKPPTTRASGGSY